MTGELNVPGLVGLIVFYLLILIVGSVAAYLKTWKRHGGHEDVIVAGRDIGFIVGVFTMTATWVGGGFLNGTTEIVYKRGLLYAQTPIGYASSLFVAGLFFAGPYRRREYLTMIDPFQEKYGRWVGGLMYFPALLGELFWSAAILNALGASVAVILGLDYTVAVIVSACIAVFYTFVGGLFSVAYTDVPQLLCIPLGLCLAIPFAWVADGTSMERAGEVVAGHTKWLGGVEDDDIGSYVDKFFLLICGGIPWQAYFQRVLSTRSVRSAQWLSFCGGIGCILLSVPPAVIGVIAQNIDWDLHNATGVLKENPSMVLPLVLAKCTPPVVTFLALGAISAAVMSSSDSSLLSASSMFAHNIYRGLIRTQASDGEVVWVLRAAVVGCGVIACSIGLSVKSVYTLFKLCGDFVFVMLFPQLLCVIYCPFANSYGVLSGFSMGLVLRLLIGVPSLGFFGLIQTGGMVPVKSLVMMANLGTTLAVSFLAQWAMRKWPTLPDPLRAFQWENGVCLGPHRIREVVNKAEASSQDILPNKTSSTLL